MSQVVSHSGVRYGIVEYEGGSSIHKFLVIVEPSSSRMKIWPWTNTWFDARAMARPGRARGAGAGRGPRGPAVCRGVTSRADSPALALRTCEREPPCLLRVSSTAMGARRWPRVEWLEWCAPLDVLPWRGHNPIGTVYLTRWDCDEPLKKDMYFVRFQTGVECKLVLVDTDKLKFKLALELYSYC